MVPHGTMCAFTAAAGYDTTWNGSVLFCNICSRKLHNSYAGFLREGNNVFQSTDGGATWSVIPGRLNTATKGGYIPRLMPQRLRSSDGGILYITFGDGAGPHTMAWDEGWGPIKDWFNRGAILKYETATQTWTNVSPENFIDPGAITIGFLYIACYSGISLNPANPLELVASTVGSRPTVLETSLRKWKDQWERIFTTAVMAGDLVSLISVLLDGRRNISVC